MYRVPTNSARADRTPLSAGMLEERRLRLNEICLDEMRSDRQRLVYLQQGLKVRPARPHSARPTIRRRGANAEKKTPEHACVPAISCGPSRLLMSTFAMPGGDNLQTGANSTPSPRARKTASRASNPQPPTAEDPPPVAEAVDGEHLRPVFRGRRPESASFRPSAMPRPADSAGTRRPRTAGPRSTTPRVTVPPGWGGAASTPNSPSRGVEQSTPATGWIVGGTVTMGSLAGL